MSADAPHADGDAGPTAGPTTDPEAALELVARALGHRFADPAHLVAALTHRSFRNERPQLAPRDNERLEFLGDAVLDLVVAELLVATYPNAREGELTRRRADLVCEATLAEVARELAVGAALRLGRGEDRSGGRQKPRLLASALEALVGAVHVDGGAEASSPLVARLLEGRLTEADDARDPKSLLQERLQQVHGSAPSYRLVGTHGPEHDQRFVALVEIEGRELGRGEGRSKADAERSAAGLALRTLEDPEADSGGEDGAA